MYKRMNVYQELTSSEDICIEINNATKEIESHCKLIAEYQAIIADLMNRVKLLEEDMIKRSCC